MERLVSTDFYNILSQISVQEMDPENIFKVFRETMPRVAVSRGIVLLRATMYEPKKRSREMNVTEVVLLDASGGEETNNIELEYATANGGRVIVVSGIKRDEIWTTECKEDCYVLSKAIYLLVGRAKTMSSLYNLMFYDQLTGIANETGLNRFMGTTIHKGKFTSYCSNFLNIKNMKLLNSRYGDAAGNIIMNGFAKAIDQFASTEGSGIAARLGGDNFLVFILQEKEDEFLQFVSNIIVPYEVGGEKHNIKVESRVGYYFIKAGDGINECMRNADVAVKLTRNNDGINVIKFEESMKTHMLKMKQLEQNVPEAIANKEFVVYYQPKVDISDEGNFRLNGAEALVRWVRDGEMVPPGEFVPVLEKNGLISLIDYYVFEQVCIDINDWIARGMTPVKVSSNFSRRHLQDKDFASKVEAIIRKHNVDTKYLEIEITESYEDEDMNALMAFEKSMHAIGVHLTVDDFGNGFSSIKMIKNIVADTIKLDKSIIDGIGNEGADDIIVSHIIQMLNKLGKNIIAEGVETKEQANFLRANGCNNIQGYLFAKPCARDVFESYM